MADIGALPTQGQKPWSLNPAITALNTESSASAAAIAGRLSPESLNALIAAAIAAAGGGGGGGLTTEERAAKPLSIFRAAMGKRLTASPVTLIFRGSSSTFGSNAATPDLRWVNKVVAKVQAAYPTAVAAPAVRTMNGSGVITGGTPSGEGVFGVNAGISGTRSGSQNGATPYVNPTSRAAQIGLNPRAFIDMIGANDYGNGVPVATFKANLIAEVNALVAGMTTQFTHIFVHSYPRFDAAAQTAKVAPWSDYLTALYEIQALYSHVAVINTAEEWAALGVNGTAGSDPWSYIDSDDIHMLSSGHDVTADIVARKLLGGVIIGTVASTGGGTGGTAPQITTTSLPSLTQNTAMTTTTLAYTGDTVTGAIVSAGTIPAGLTLSLSAGVVTVSGTPTGSGAYDFTVEVSNGAGSDLQQYANTIAAAGGGSAWTTVIRSDSFDRANSATLGSTDAYLGGPVTAWQTNAATTHQIASNTLAVAASAGGAMQPVDVADYEIRFQIADLGNATGTTLYTIDGRRSTLASSGATQYRLYPRSNGQAYLAAGTSTVIIPSTSVPVGTFAVGDWIGLRFKGSAISIIKASAGTGAGTVIATVTDTSQATPSAGFAGTSRVAGTTGAYSAMTILVE